MSGQNYYDQSQSGGQQGYGNTAPYHQGGSAQNPWQDQPSSGTPYAPPPGPPPGQQQQPVGQPPRRTGTFEETAFVPEDERGEQREAMEQFELSKPQSEEDRDLETLQREFPSMDGSLVAALYSDSKSLSGTREMLQELASSQ